MVQRGSRNIGRVWLPGFGRAWPMESYVRVFGCLHCIQMLHALVQYPLPSLAPAERLEFSFLLGLAGCARERASARSERRLPPCSRVRAGSS